MLLIQVLLIQVSTIIIFDNLYVQNQSTTTAQALARTKTRMTTWLNSKGLFKAVLSLCQDYGIIEGFDCDKVDSVFDHLENRSEALTE